MCLQAARRQERSVVVGDPDIRQRGKFFRLVLPGGIPGRGLQPVRHGLGGLHQQCLDAVGGLELSGAEVGEPGGLEPGSGHRGEIDLEHGAVGVHDSSSASSGVREAGTSVFFGAREAAPVRRILARSLASEVARHQLAGRGRAEPGRRRCPCAGHLGQRLERHRLPARLAESRGGLGVHAPT